MGGVGKKIWPDPEQRALPLGARWSVGRASTRISSGTAMVKAGQLQNCRLSSMCVPPSLARTTRVVSFLVASFFTLYTPPLWRRPCGHARRAGGHARSDAPAPRVASTWAGTHALRRSGAARRQHFSPPAPLRCSAWHPARVALSFSHPTQPRPAPVPPTAFPAPGPSPPQVPVRTIKSWLRAHAKFRYARPSEEMVDEMVQRARTSQHLRSGVESVKGWIRGNLCVRLPRKVVARSLARVVPPPDRLEQEVKDLQVYHNRGPWACIHSDGNHKV